MNQTRKIFFCILLAVYISLSSATASARTADVFDYNQGAKYSSWEYYDIAQTMAAAYPEILHLEVIGSSRDSKPIYAMIMTANVKEAMAREDFNLVREHYYVEAGTHGRETVNTPIIIKAMEDYAKDYYDDSHIPEFNLKSELSKAVIHFIPLVNPDGFDLVKFGAGSVNTPTGKNLLSAVAATDYSDFKANIAGVDLNRNYPDEYYDPITKKWVNKFQVYRGLIDPDDPTNGYYAGPYGGSEPETAAVMNYVQRYDFRNFLSFHSQGKFIDCGKYWFGVDYNKRSLDLATAMHNVNNYKVEAYSSGEESGFFSDYVAAQTLKPVVTIETTSASLPTDQVLYKEAYEENYLLPLYAVKHGRETGYFKYRLYFDNSYIRDFNDYVYAKAHADKLPGSVIVEDAGVPDMTLEQAMTGGNFSINSSRELSDIQNHWAKATIEHLIQIGAVNGYEDATFKPDHTITRAEFLKLACTSAARDAGAATIATAESMSNHWAAGIFEAAVEQGIIEKGELLPATWDKPITRYEMIRILIRLSENTLGKPKASTIDIESMMSDYDQVLKNETYAYYVQQAYAKGLIKGIDESGTFAGDDTGTRAQAAAMVLSLIESPILE